MRIFFLCVLCLCAMLGMLPTAVFAKEAKAAKAGSPQTMQQTVDALLPLLNGSGKRSRMDSMEALRKAGFSYEKHLIVPPDVDISCKNQDERNVIAGMRSVDWDYAVIFGQPAEQGRVCILPYSKGARTIASPPLQDQEWQKIQTDPVSSEARKILFQRSLDFQGKLLQEARKSPEALQALGARLYGGALENLYITCILVLAASESDSLPYLKKLQAASFTAQTKILRILLRNRHLGAQQYYRERATLVEQVRQLLEKQHGKPRLKDLEEVLHLIQPERDRYLSPCAR